MPNAIVTGATGILGRGIVAALGNNAKQWQTVYALSRSQKENFPPNVKTHLLDLTKDAHGMAKQLEGVQAEYVFFAAYLQKDTDQENWDVNGAMLKNFLEALEITGAAKQLKRVIITAGAKQYGLHLGPPKQPMEESDPWVEGEGRPPNFYYYQQRILADKAKNAHWDWVVTYPNDVIGVAKGNFMNIATSIGLYAAISKELDGNLVFPGSPTFYTMFDSFTYSPLHADFNIWSALEPNCGNQAFNIVNGDTESWQNLWPKIARRFGGHIPRNQFNIGLGEDPSSSVELAERPPIADVAAQIGLENNVQRGRVEQKCDLIKWSQREDVQKAWERLQERDGLDKDAFAKATWGFLGFVLGRTFSAVISMSKARRYGWTGYVDTWEALSQCFDELEREKILPKAKYSEA
ncbi:uncharacterized protein KY384_005792 [Bacidia gigantensis]|uniref:uncharacterized protein n=1 Tax=Bacidia gigantensis TaxID=2732470 RepID=UPI001D03F442|nr:uncharacterized protein KY384_005792 [Bacidia gigantensis]KAG8529157.1 hypothetical protein KY384_005792 [Bacidia gigantensis]